MAIKIMPSATTEYTLEISDAALNEEGTPPTTVLIRQTSQGDEERRAQLFAKWRTSVTAEGADEFVREFNYQQLKRLEVYLALADCSLTNGETGAALFTFRNGRVKDQATFNSAWDMLPVIIANEIHSKVLLSNPDWDLVRGE